MTRPRALLLTFLTGFSGLVYEVTWEKALATLLGSHAEATASVLGLFLGGLALGYTLFGHLTTRRLAAAARSGRPTRLLTLYGIVEATIGLSALAFPILFRGVQALSFALPAAAGPGGFAIDVALAALLVLPPAVLMGGTIPILTQALSRDVEESTRVHAWVYGINTAGAFAGALGAGFWIVPTLGIEGALRWMAAVNLFAGAGFLWLGRQPERASGSASASTATVERAAAGFSAFASAALCVGFAMMTLQTVLIRLGGLSFGASQLTFSLVVAVFVLCIALGSFAVSALRRVPGWLLVADLWALVVSFLLLYVALPQAPYWAHRLRALFPLDPAAFYDYHLAAFLGVLVAIGIPVMLSGAALPLIFDHLRSRLGELGDLAGRLYGWNTFGSLLGALLGGYALLFWLDLDQVFQVALAALVGAALLATARGLPPRRRRLVPLALLPTLAVFLLPSWPRDRLAAGLFRIRTANEITLRGADAVYAERAKRFRTVFYADDPVASVAVLEVLEGSERVDLALWVNGKPDSAVLGDAPTTVMLGVLPALMADRAENVFVIGYGTGSTVGTLTQLEGVKRIVVAEMSPSVVRAAPLFEAANGAALTFPGLEVVESDAYRALLRSDELFDLIVSEPSNLWVLGVEMLYSREFLEAARARLTPGGVHCHWFHAYETDDRTLATVLRTYRMVFDHVAVWYGHGTDLVLLGLTRPEGALDVDRLAERVEREDVAAALERIRIHNLPALLAHELLPVGVVNVLPLEGDEHTLLHPRLGYLAARAFFAGATAPLPMGAFGEAAEVGRRNSLLGRYARRRGGLSERELAQVVRETCRHRSRECATAHSRWRRDAPDSQLLARFEARPRWASGASQSRALADRIERLFDAGANGAVEFEDPVVAAQRATELFQSQYHHALPFDLETLRALWRRCLREAPQRCRAALASSPDVRSVLELEP